MQSPHLSDERFTAAGAVLSTRVNPKRKSAAERHRARSPACSAPRSTFLWPVTSRALQTAGRRAVQQAGAATRLPERAVHDRPSLHVPPNLPDHTITHQTTSVMQIPFQISFHPGNSPHRVRHCILTAGGTLDLRSAFSNSTTPPQSRCCSLSSAHHLPWPGLDSPRQARFHLRQRGCDVPVAARRVTERGGAGRRSARTGRGGSTTGSCGQSTLRAPGLAGCERLAEEPLQVHLRIGGKAHRGGPILQGGMRK